MGAEITTGLFALAGAGVGGLASFGATWLTQKTLRQQNVQARAHNVADRRYEAHLDHLARVNTVIDAALELWTTLGNGVTGQHLQDAHARYSEEWRRYSESRAAAELAGPPDLANASRQLYDKLSAFADRLDIWFQVDGRGNVNDELSDKLEAAKTERDKYLDRARTEIWG